MKRRKIKYESEIKTYTFFHEEKEIITTIEVFYKIVPPDYDSWDSPEDYYGYTELQSWKVISVEDHEGNEVKPEDVLTEKQLLAYTAGLTKFIEE